MWMLYFRHLSEVGGQFRNLLTYAPYFHMGLLDQRIEPAHIPKSQTVLFF